MAAELNTEEGQDQYLLGALAMAAVHRRGLRLGDNEIYACIPPPVIAGSFAVDDLHVFEFSVAVNAAGQLHRSRR